MTRTLLAALIMALIPGIASAETLEELLARKGVITSEEGASLAAPKIFWNNGTRLEFPSNGFTISIGTFMQERYQFTDYNKKAGKPNTSSFEFKKARIIIQGTALNNEFSYYLMPDFVGGTAEGSNQKVPALLDAIINWHPFTGFELTAGQYRTLMSRQYTAVTWQMLMPDDSIVSDYFNFGRNGGLTASYATQDKVFAARAGVFNGNSDGEGINRPGVDTKELAIAGVRVNPLGTMNAYEETDINYTEDPAFSFGAMYAYAGGNNDLGAGLEGTSKNEIDIDANMKWRGFSFNGEFFYYTMSAASLGDAVQPLGFYTQAGYFLMPQQLEAAARYSLLDCDEGKAPGNCAGNRKINEVTAALNYYFWKHYLKASLEYSLINKRLVQGGSADTNKWLLQLQTYF